MPIIQMQTSLHVQWTYEFSSCSNYTVLLNGLPVENCENISDQTCFINSIVAGVHNITVAGTSRAQPVSNSQSVTVERIEEVNGMTL